MAEFILKLVLAWQGTFIETMNTRVRYEIGYEWDLFN